MSRKTEAIDCPNNPDHGLAFKRWLRGEYQQVSGVGGSMPVADIFEINCNMCGKYEHRVERSRKLDASEASVRKLMGR